jgi:hypothetical protein
MRHPQGCSFTPRFDFTDKLKTPQEFHNLLHIGPLPVLYQHLIAPKKTRNRDKDPTKTRTLKPPLIHCGFASEEFLIDYARRHDLLQEWAWGIRRGSRPPEARHDALCCQSYICRAPNYLGQAFSTPIRCDKRRSDAHHCAF